MDLRATREATKARVRRRTSFTTTGGRERELLETPLGQILAGPHFGPLVDYFSRKQGGKKEAVKSIKQDYPAPEWLAEAIKNIKPEVLALATLAPVVHACYRGGLDEQSPLRDLKQKIGEKLDDHLHLGWDNEKRVRAGHWLLDAAILNLNCFKVDEHGVELLPGSEAELDRLRDEMFRNDPAWRPFTEPPPDWKGFQNIMMTSLGRHLYLALQTSKRKQSTKHLNHIFRMRRPLIG